MSERDESLELILIDGLNGLGVLYSPAHCEDAPELSALLAEIKTTTRIAGELLKSLEDERISLQIREVRLTQQLVKAFEQQAESRPVAGLPLQAEDRANEQS